MQSSLHAGKKPGPSAFVGCCSTYFKLFENVSSAMVLSISRTPLAPQKKKKIFLLEGVVASPSISTF